MSEEEDIGGERKFDPPKDLETQGNWRREVRRLNWILCTSHTFSAKYYILSQLIKIVNN